VANPFEKKGESTEPSDIAARNFRACMSQINLEVLGALREAVCREGFDRLLRYSDYNICRHVADGRAFSR
jgi:hypothetical protein